MNTPTAAAKKLAAESIDLYWKICSRVRTPITEGEFIYDEIALLVDAFCAERTKELQAHNTAEWSTLMADVHDYFKDEKADRSRGRVTLVLTLLGQLRIQRDAATAELAALRAENAALKEDKERLDWLEQDRQNHINRMGANHQYYEWLLPRPVRAAIDAARKDAQ